MNRANRSLTLLAVVLLSLLLTGCAQPAADVPGADYAGTTIDPPIQLADFSMPSSLGRDLSLSELRGKPMLLFFGFTFCPDICPTTLADLKRAKDALGADAEQLQVVFISVDPERDTPEVLARHLATFDQGFIGLQGDEATLRRIGKAFGLYYQRTNTGGATSYTVDHSSALYLIDSQGRLRTLFSYGTPPDVLTAATRKLLDE